MDTTMPSRQDPAFQAAIDLSNYDDARDAGTIHAIWHLTQETRRTADALERIAKALEMSYKHGLKVYTSE